MFLVLSQKMVYMALLTAEASKLRTSHGIGAILGGTA
jgi:hypothetical protein